MQKQALQAIVWVETGLGWRSSLRRRNGIAFPKRSRFRYPHTIRLIRWIRAFVDSAAPFGRSITTASTSAVKCDRASALGVAVCAGLAALRAARLAAVLAQEHDRADSDIEDRVGDLPGADVRVCDGAVAVAHAAKVRAGWITAKAVGVG